jgi:hypothetical protein
VQNERAIFLRPLEALTPLRTRHSARWLWVAKTASTSEARKPAFVISGEGEMTEGDSSETLREFHKFQGVLPQVRS